jgi:hypothetical protein
MLRSFLELAVSFQCGRFDNYAAQFSAPNKSARKLSAPNTVIVTARERGHRKDISRNTRRVARGGEKHFS